VVKKFSLKQTVKPLFCLFFIQHITGCTSTQSSEASLSKPVNQDYPSWVIKASDQRFSSLGASCVELKGMAYKDKLNAKAVAENAARLNLFEKSGGQQEISAVEMLDKTQAGELYSVKIKLKSSGEIGRNRIVKEGVYVVNNITNYCVAIELTLTEENNKLIKSTV
jgi:hypothetical protein